MVFTNYRRTFESLYSGLKTLGPWWHYLDSTWIIKTDMNSSQIWNVLAYHILSTDYLLIVKIENSDKWGWLPPDAWGWLNSQM